MPHQTWSTATFCEGRAEDKEKPQQTHTRGSDSAFHPQDNWKGGTRDLNQDRSGPRLRRYFCSLPPGVLSQQTRPLPPANHSFPFPFVSAVSERPESYLTIHHLYHTIISPKRMALQTFISETYCKVTTRPHFRKCTYLLIRCSRWPRYSAVTTTSWYPESLALPQAENMHVRRHLLTISI